MTPRSGQSKVLAILLLGLACLLFSLVLREFKQTETPLQKPKDVTEILNEDSRTRILKLSKVKAIGNPKGKVIKRTSDGWIEDRRVCRSQEKFQKATFKSLVGSIPIYVHDKVDGLSRNLLKSGRWEPDLEPHLLRCFGNDQDLVFVDIGANIGVFSLELAKSGRRVISVEPRLANAARLCRSMRESRLSQNWTLVFNAVSDERQAMEVVQKRRPGRTYVREGVRGGGWEETVYSIHLDDLLEVFPHITKAVVKIDVERHEARALAHAHKFFKQVDVPCLMMEFERHNRSPDGYRLMLEMAEYGFLAYDPKNWKKSLDASTFGKWPRNIMWRQIRDYGPETP